MRVTILAGLLVASGMFGQAEAATWCQYSRTTAVTDGSTVDKTLKIVVSSVPRPVYPGHTADFVWCKDSWRVLGGFGGLKILEQPKQGQLHAKGYFINYRGDKIGHDHFSVEMKWYGRSNEPNSGIINYDVETVAAPF